LAKTAGIPEFGIPGLQSLVYTHPSTSGLTGSLAILYRDIVKFHVVWFESWETCLSRRCYLLLSSQTDS